jgi:predicted GNAT family acetyltransferase
MEEIQLKLEPNGQGAFFIEREGERLAEMVMAVDDKNLTVFHTEVSPKLKGEGIGIKLLTTMVDYARKHRLKVIALCPFVNAQFKRHPELYADVWNQDWAKTR